MELNGRRRYVDYSCKRSKQKLVSLKSTIFLRRFLRTFQNFYSVYNNTGEWLLLQTYSSVTGTVYSRPSTFQKGLRDTCFLSSFSMFSGQLFVCDFSQSFRTYNIHSVYHNADGWLLLQTIVVSQEQFTLDLQLYKKGLCKRCIFGSFSVFLRSTVCMGSPPTFPSKGALETKGLILEAKFGVDP